MSHEDARRAAEFPSFITITYHACGRRLESDGWCPKCQTPGLLDCVKVPYVQTDADDGVLLSLAAQALPAPSEEPLPALVYTPALGGEFYEHAVLDLTVLVPSPRTPAAEVSPHQIRVRAMESGSLMQNPEELATLYLDAAGARRLAALLLGVSSSPQDSTTVSPPPGRPRERTSSDAFSAVFGDARGRRTVRRQPAPPPTRSEVEARFANHDGAGLSELQLDGRHCVLCDKGGGQSWPVGRCGNRQLFAHVACCRAE